MEETNGLPDGWTIPSEPIEYTEAKSEQAGYYRPAEESVAFVAMNTELHTLLECRSISMSLSSNDAKTTTGNDGTVKTMVTSEAITTEGVTPMIDVLALTDNKQIDVDLTDTLGAHLFPDTMENSLRKVEGIVALATQYNNSENILSLIHI